MEEGYNARVGVLSEEKLKRFCDKLLYFRLLCLSLHTNRAYKANIISTIVDQLYFLTFAPVPIRPI